jgi:CubicO group peptidase (beta-lactamase class C family)
MGVAPRASGLPLDDESSAAADIPINERVERIALGLVPPLRLEGEPVFSRSLTEAMVESEIPAMALAIVDDCDVVWAGGWGTLGDERTRVTASTPFQVGSVSKMVTAIVAMRIVAEGQLDLDRPVNELLTSWKLPDNELTRDHPVLLRHLLSHSAGLTRTAYWLDRNEPMPDLAVLLSGEAGNPAITVEEVPGRPSEPT